MSYSSETMEPCRTQQAIKAKCLHPSGAFTAFVREEIEQSIPDRFEKLVKMYPDRVAVKMAGTVFTYGDLNATANRLATAILARQGNKAEPVALLFEKGPLVAAAMLAVLKAGKFFVLLDPTFPKSRIAAVLEDSQSEWLITNRQNASLTGEVINTRCRVMECEAIDPNYAAEDLKLSMSPKALACIMYTSGSTGQAKGVVWNHRNWLHKIMLSTNHFLICERDRVTLLGSQSPNAITTTFLALLNGAGLFPFDVQQKGVKQLASWLSDESISFCLISSPLFRALCENLGPNDQFPDLRLIRVASEAVYKRDLDLFKKHFSRGCVFATGLSLAETGYVRIYYADHDTQIDSNEIPVGYAVEDKAIVLLNEAGKEVGFNEVGEIAVKSRHLACGYWRRPDLTKAKFNPDPDSSENFLYLTGDLGLILPDGCLIHKGRKDFRTKIRGHGVEIAEVERALLTHPAITEAVVVAHKAASGEARLIAYFVSSVQPVPTINELRTFLKKKLPDYMLPSTFVMLDAMPLTTNGKIERQALPDPGKSRPALDTPFLAPRTPLEDEMAHAWAEVLSLDLVGIDDNFFDLGGHSLLATQVIARMRDMFQVEIPLQNFFEAPTVADLAMFILRDWAAQEGQEQVQRHIANIKSD